MQYGLYLKSAPASAAALIVPNAPASLVSQILKGLEHERRTVQMMEKTEHGRQCVNQHCRYILYQQYRELMGVLAKHSWKMHEEVFSVLKSWFQPMASSSNIEQIFGELSWAIKKSGKSDLGSMPNMMAVAIRSLARRLCEGPECATPIQLESCDFEGREAQALKAKLWSPASAVPSLCLRSVLCRPHPHILSFLNNFF